MASEPARDDSGDLTDLVRALGLPDTERTRATETPDIRIDREAIGTGRRDDDRFLQRFYGSCVLLAGVATIIPAVVQWVDISQADEIRPVPRWVYLLGLPGGCTCCMRC